MKMTVGCERLHLRFRRRNKVLLDCHDLSQVRKTHKFYSAALDDRCKLGIQRKAVLSQFGELIVIVAKRKPALCQVLRTLKPLNEYSILVRVRFHKDSFDARLIIIGDIQPIICGRPILKRFIEGLEQRLIVDDQEVVVIRGPISIEGLIIVLPIQERRFLMIKQLLNLGLDSCLEGNASNNILIVDAAQREKASWHNYSVSKIT